MLYLHVYYYYCFRTQQCRSRIIYDNYLEANIFFILGYVLLLYLMAYADHAADVADTYI